MGSLCHGPAICDSETSILLCHVVSLPLSYLLRYRLNNTKTDQISVSDYATKVFGFATFGQVYGMIICLSGLVNMSQVGLNSLTLITFHGDPTPVNIILGVLGLLVGGILVVYVKRKVGDVGTENSDLERRPLLSVDEG